MKPSIKIKSVSQIASEMHLAKSEGKQIVLCHGEFDLLHLGHMKYFQAAKQFGEILIVTLTPDRFVAKGPGRPVFSEDLRAEAIASLECVDWVGVNEWETAEETLKLIQPDIYVKGSEYLSKVDGTGRLEKEKTLIESLGGKLQFTHDIIFSSSKLLNKHLPVYTKASEDYLNRLAENYDASEIVEAVDKIRSLKILVIGEVRIDQHQLCQSANWQNQMGMIRSQFKRPMGALTIVNTLTDFCDELDLVAMTGASLDEIKTFIPNEIKLHLFSHPSYKIPTSIQFWNEEASHLDFKTTETGISPICQEEEFRLIRFLESKLSQYDCVLVADLGMGMMSPSVIRLLEEQAQFLAVSTGSQDLHPSFNPVSNYSGLDYVCMEKAALSSLFENPFFSLSDWVKGLPFRNELANIILTQEHGGILSWSGTKFQELPPFVDESRQPAIPQDVNNAIFALTAPLTSTKTNWEEIEFISNAINSLIKQNKEPIFRMERLLLNKFLITLLNR